MKIRGEVLPGDNLSADAEGLADSVGEFIGRRFDNLPMDLVGPAGIVLKDFVHFVDVRGGVAKRLAVVPGVNCGECIFVLGG